ncbi:MAG: conjugal transfer protein TraF [Endomicrobiales bacterium]
MKSLKRCIYLSLVATLFAATLHADEPQVFIRGIRPLGMGGAFVAISDDQNAIFYNPAGLTQRQGSEFIAFELPISISQDVLNFYDFYNDNQNTLQNFSNLSQNQQVSLLNEINDKITTYKPEIRFGFPNTCYLSGNQAITWGIGVFDQAQIGFQFNRSLIVPSLSMYGDVDGILAVPLAHRFDVLPVLPGSMSLGVTLKAIQRYSVNELNESVLEFQNFSPQLQTGQGFGADAGALYQPNSRWNIGVQVTDVGGTTIKYAAQTASQQGQVNQPAYTSMISPEWNTGVAYIPSKIMYWPGKYISSQDRLILAFDLRDVADYAGDSPLFAATGWVKVHMGAELRLGPLSLRGGYNSGYPTYGFGLRIPYLGLRVDYANWADEMGLFAGQIPQWNQQITIALSWGDAKGRPYGNDVKPRDEEPTIKIKHEADESAVPVSAKPDQPAPVAVSAPAAAPNSTMQNAIPVVPAATPVATSATAPGAVPVSPVTVTPQQPQNPTSVPAAQSAATAPSKTDKN